jgi:hypothetical protein
MKNTKEKKNNVLMAQTTLDACFGPILVIAARLNLPRPYKTYVEPK